LTSSSGACAAILIFGRALQNCWSISGLGALDEQLALMAALALGLRVKEIINYDRIKDGL
jgi:hypothetical protein